MMLTLAFNELMMYVSNDLSLYLKSLSTNLGFYIMSVKRFEKATI